MGVTMLTKQVQGSSGSDILFTFILAALVAGLTALLLTGCATPGRPANPLNIQNSSNLQREMSLTQDLGEANKGRESAVYYSLPTSVQPEGKIGVISKGVESIRTRRSESEMATLHLQLIVTNDNSAGKSGRTWMIDARSQVLKWPGDLQLRPALVKAEAVVLPLIEIRAGQTETIDLFYAIPKQLQTRANLPAFEVEWQIQTARRLVIRTTKFNEPLKSQSYLTVYPFDRDYRTEGSVDYPAMDSTLAPKVPPDMKPDLHSGNYDSHGGPAVDPTTDPSWWADPFTEFPFSWRDMVY